MADKITFDDKVSLTTSALPRANKCTAEDINEIKTVVNSNADILDETNETIQTVDNKIYAELAQGTNIDTLKANGKYGIYNATGTLPSGFSSSDNNVIVECIMWNTDYGRQILHDVRTANTFIRRINGGVWQSWHMFTTT